MFWNCMSRHSLSEHFRVHGALLNLFDKSPPLDMQTGDLQPCGPRAEYDWLSTRIIFARVQAEDSSTEGARNNG
jgi:hypothetical protein